MKSTMIFKVLTFTLTLVSLVYCDTLKGGNKTRVFETVFQWSKFEFAYPSNGARDAAIASGAYIPENAAPLCIAASSDRIFIATPRWKKGVAASLSTINYSAYSKSPALEPYPSWSAHSTVAEPDCSKIMSVYRHTIDECGRLFVVDTGVFDGSVRLCPPKILVYDLKTDQQIFNYTLPEDQVLQGSLHANVIVDVHKEDCGRAFAYVMDIFRNEILVFDMEKMKSWRTKHHYYMPEPRYSEFSYQGLTFYWTDGVFGGVLSAQEKVGDDRTLYFHSMSSISEFSVQTSILRNETAWLTGKASKSAFKLIGNRGQLGHVSTSDIAPNGVSFSAQVSLDGVSCWDTKKPHDLNNMQMVQRGLGFVNDLKIDSDRKNIWIVSNNLPTYFYSKLNYTRSDNYRFMRANIEHAISKSEICKPLTRPFLDVVDVRVDGERKAILT